MFSASSEACDRNAPTNANQIRLQTSRIRQEHRPIRYQLPARLSFRQGQPAAPFDRLHALRLWPGCETVEGCLITRRPNQFAHGLLVKELIGAKHPRAVDDLLLYPLMTDDHPVCPIC